MHAVAGRQVRLCYPMADNRSNACVELLSLPHGEKENFTTILCMTRWIELHETNVVDIVLEIICVP